MPRRATPTPPSIRRALRDVGRHLSDWRRLQDLTVEQTADRAGLSMATLHRIERGDGGSAENILRVARALGVLDQVVVAFDPTTTDIGRARALDALPRRASGGRRRAP
ncbi:MAG: helix-turn-helix transcriptional regulator [Thermoleophilia bacterium]